MHEPYQKAKKVKVKFNFKTPPQANPVVSGAGPAL
jgi:hypothetical protein